MSGGAATYYSAPAQIAAHGRDSGFRSDVEGIRALAVIAVVLFHAQVGWLPGGFSGVDVFFVVSGFLITRQLLDEVDRTGRLALPRFWARRARRLLPASCLVIVTTLVAAHWMLPALTQRRLVGDAAAAVLFVSNIAFAKRYGDYFGGSLADTNPLLHFWSLSVEEQFYLFWPAILFVVARHSRQVRRLLGLVIAVVGSASLLLCIWMTPRVQAWPYYLLATRAWELLAGAALAVAGLVFAKLAPHVRAVYGWIGVAGLAYSFLRIDESGFPGTRALIPILSTVLLLIAGTGPSIVGSPAHALSVRPLQWVGTRSYGIYLWHWPALVLMEAYFGPLDLPRRLAVAGASFGAAALTYRLVEDPIRHAPRLVRDYRLALRMGGGLVAIGLFSAVMLQVTIPPIATERVAAAPSVIDDNSLDAELSGQQALTDDGSATDDTNVDGETAPNGTDAAPAEPVGTEGATETGTVLPKPSPTMAKLIKRNEPVLEEALATNEVPKNLRPGISQAPRDKPAIYENGCIAGPGVIEPKACWYGDSQSSRRVVLFGDSHAAMWFPAMEKMARNRGWALLVLTKQGCPIADVPIAIAAYERTCDPWRRKAIEMMANNNIDLVVMTSYRYRPAGNAIGRNSNTVWREGLDKTLESLRPVVQRVLILGDTPTPKSDVPVCLSGRIKAVQKCTSSRDKAVKVTRLGVEYELAQKYEAEFVTTSDWMCTDSACPVIVGDILLFRDESHLTTAASVYFEPFLRAAVVPLV
jgi:peptidoglycan/LPS O-acetylase OafA/YrhL